MKINKSDGKTRIFVFISLFLLIISSLTISASAAPILGLLKTAATDDGLPAHEGTVVHYTYTISNTGADAAQNVKLYDTRTYPAPSGSNAVFVIGTVSPGIANAVIVRDDYTVTETDCCLLTKLGNTAIANGTWNGNVYSSVQKSALVTIAVGTSIKLYKSSSSNPFSYAHIGDRVTYNYSVENTGGITVHGVHVVDVPLGTVTLDVTDLAPGHFANGTIEKQITAADYPEFYNSANAIATSCKTTSTAGAIVNMLIIKPNITVDKTSRAPHSGALGNIIYFDMTVTNNGDSMLTDIVATDLLPKGLSYYNAGTDPQPINVVPNVNGTTTITWELGDLFDGDSVTVTLVSQVNGDEYGEVTNSVNVIGIDMAGSPVDDDDPTFRINGLNAHQFFCYRFFKESIYFNALVCAFRVQIRFTPP
jgi:uncharacterized repeat protein (TIGR01451 family)